MVSALYPANSKAKFAVRLAVKLLLMSLFAAAQVPYPKPQIASAEGKAAADFTLKDQAGRDFHLAARRGRPVLLVFYRGYW